jgi:hypothetical protein
MIFYLTYFLVVAKLVSLDWKSMFEGLASNGILIVTLWTLFGFASLYIGKSIMQSA